MGNDVGGAQPAKSELRALVLPPTRADGEALTKLLGNFGIDCIVFSTVNQICNEIEHGAGTLLISEESLLAETDALASCLANQPVWSDFPVIVLSRSGAEAASLAQTVSRLGNVSVVERPIRVMTLVSLVQSALRARQRQYQVRDHLVEREHSEIVRDQLLKSERVARSEAERAGRMKDEFLATVSHELRTPLNSMFGWAQILQRTDGLTEELREGLAIIERSARSQTQIIEDLLDMSRIISGKVRLDVQRVDLAAVINAAIETVRPATEAKGIRLQVVLAPLTQLINGDPNRLQQVFWNLLTNAVKFTPEGGRVSVTLQRVNSHLEISIADTGQGIEREFLPYVFDRFRQADATTTRHHGGLGLGLSIVKQLVELHGGTISAISPGVGRGATFRVTLPVMMMNTEPDSSNESKDRLLRSAVSSRNSSLSSTDLAGIKVLVVDDEPDARSLMQRLLEECRACVITASSAAEAFDMLGKEQPDVLISDIGMPEQDGYAFIRKVRALGNQQSHVPAIALTAYARTEDRIQAITAGFQLHLSKPVEPAELVAMVASLIR